MGLENYPVRRTLRVITRTRRNSRRTTGNAYRETLARHFPEPAIVMLCFLWGIWLYDGYLGPPAEAPAETQQLALQSIDRELRLADDFAGRPQPLRWLAGVLPLDDQTERAIRQLEEVWRVRRLDIDGAVVRSILLADLGRDEEAAAFSPPEPTLESRLLDARLDGRAAAPTDLQQLAGLLESDDARWWHLVLARSFPEAAGFAAGVELQKERNGVLAQRVFVARSLVWLLVLAGAAFVPRGLRLLGAGARRRSTGYAARWPFSLAIGIFLVCELAGIGISGTYGFLSAMIGTPPFLAYIGIDSAARLIPALLACAFLFHRPRHAARVFGLARPIPWSALLGVFTLVFLFQESLRLSLGDLIPVDPTGGLEVWSSGWGGLAAMIISACIVAPIGEEVLYRGVLFQGFSNRFGPLVAAGASALIFTIVHFYGLYGTLGVGILGAALALVYNGSQSLTAVIVFHAIYNLTVTLPDWIVDHAPY